jgi:hypothetical protein
VASYRKDDLCAKAAPPSHAPSFKGPVFVTSTGVFVYIRRTILQRPRIDAGSVICGSDPLPVKIPSI